MAFINTVTTADFTVYYSDDGATPNGALSGAAGDICNASTGTVYLCSGGTTWSTLGVSGQVEIVRENFPAVVDGTVQYPGVAVFDCVLVGVQAHMTTKTTSGTYTLTVTNQAQGLSMLSGATFNMAGLTNGAYSALPIASGAAITFDAGDRWLIDLTSAGGGFDGTGIIIVLTFARS